MPSFLIVGEKDLSPGAGLDAAEELHALLSDRLSEVCLSYNVFVLFYSLVLVLVLVSYYT